MQTPFFELQHISKYFAKVIANQDISFSIDRGEILALLGENGAGKSTIMKILYGLYRADEGKILMDGKEQKITSPKDAMSLGISMIQQHFSLVPAHSVVENIILGNVHGKIDYQKQSEMVQALCDQYGFDIPIQEKIEHLDVGTQQKVEILKALYLNANLLIMDEPTAVLTPQESDSLMDFVKEYTAQGHAVIFITHKLKEVMKVADKIVVMRNGRVCGNRLKDETNEHELSQLMIGHDLEQLPTEQSIHSANETQVCLSLDHITIRQKQKTPILHDISFQIHHGEIFGIAGVSGNGQEELCEVICGDLLPTSGTILLNERDITHQSIRERLHAGIGYVPVDRHRDAMVMDMSLSENMLLKSSYDSTWKYGPLIDYKTLRNYTQKAIEEYQIKTAGPEAAAKDLSGGNQQKVVLAREVDHGKELLVLNQPTRGLDLGAIHNIHSVILEQRNQGKGILLVSTELSEIFALCDRIAVMYKGAFMGIYKKEELSTETIGLLMAGYREEKKEASR